MGGGVDMQINSKEKGIDLTVNISAARYTTYYLPLDCRFIMSIPEPAQSVEWFKVRDNYEGALISDWRSEVR